MALIGCTVDCNRMQMNIAIHINFEIILEYTQLRTIFNVQCKMDIIASILYA